MSTNRVGLGWTEERVALLRKLWQDGRSASEISRQLGGVSRSAVLGKLHRIGLAERGLASAPRRHERKPASPKIRPAPTRVFIPRAKPSPLPPLVAFDPTLTARPWTERLSGQCTWPLGDDLSCCAPVHKRGWCASHFAIGTQPPKSGQDAKGLTRALRRYIA